MDCNVTHEDVTVASHMETEKLLENQSNTFFPRSL